MTTSNVIPDSVFGTGGVESTAGAVMAIGVLGGQLETLFGDCCYCLDAPESIPSGAMHAGALYPAPVLSRRP